MRGLVGLALLGGALGGAACGPAWGAVRVVGEGQAYPTLAAAVRAAGDGDTIHVKPGTYYECAVLPQRDLVLEGEGPASILTDATCEGKALLIARGAGLTVRNLVLARARVPDRNGAGVRLEAAGLTLEGVRFENDEVGVLAGQDGPGVVTLRDCVFSGGGVAGERPSFALLVGAVDRLRVERSRFEQVKGGQISSAARQTELVGNTIGTGVEPGAGPAVSASGMLVMRENGIGVGPAMPPREAAVLALGPGAVLERNRLVNTTGPGATLLLDWTGSTPGLSGNEIGPGDTLVSQAGLVRHRAGGMAREMEGQLRGAAGAAKRAVRGVLGR